MLRCIEKGADGKVVARRFHDPESLETKTDADVDLTKQAGLNSLRSA